MQYQLDFPNWQYPDRLAIESVVWQLRKTGKDTLNTVEAGRPATAITSQREEEILARVAADPRTSIRYVGSAINMRHQIVYEILLRNKIYPYRFANFSAWRW